MTPTMSTLMTVEKEEKHSLCDIITEECTQGKNLKYPTGKNRLNSHHGFFCGGLQSVCDWQVSSHEVALWVC